MTIDLNTADPDHERLRRQLKQSLVLALVEKIENIPKRCLHLPALPDDATCRPDHVTLWAGPAEDDYPPHVTIYIEPLHGQQARYLDLTSDEARTMARFLAGLADELDKILHAHASAAEGA